MSALSVGTLPRKRRSWVLRKHTATSVSVEINVTLPYCALETLAHEATIHNEDHTNIFGDIVAQSLVENMVKKNRIRFSTTVLLTTVLLYVAVNAKSCYT